MRTEHGQHVLFMMSIAHKLSIVWMIACAALPVMTAQGAISPEPPPNVPPPPPLMTTAFVRVTVPWIAVPIQSTPVTCEVGSHVMLIQENDDFFITMCSNRYEGAFLAAFPVNSREGRPAWTTPEEKVFFAYRTTSCRGTLYFKQGDELPVDAETRNGYKVRLERFGHAFPLYLSRTNSGVEFIAAPPPPTPAQMAQVRATQKAVAAAAATQKTPTSSSPKLSAAAPPRLPPVKRYIVTPVGPSTNVFTIAVLPPSLSTSTTARADGKTEGLFTRLFSKTEKPAASPGKSAAAVSEKPGPPKTTAAPARKPETDQKEEPALAAKGSASPEPPPAAPKTDLKTLFSTYGIPVLAGAVLLFLVGGLLLKRRGKSARPETEKKTPEAPGDTVAAETSSTPAIPGALNDFSGSIASMSLGSVTQFLNSDKETGTLVIKDKGNSELGTLIFIKGEIVDARSPKKRGLDALYEVLRHKEGFFSFLREEPKNVEKTITQGTISLLLDAHRIMDEEVSPASPPPPIPHAPAPKPRPAAPKPVTKLKLHGSR